jgi:RNA-binding protein
MNSKQKQHLKALAHDLDPTAHVGKNGLTPEALAHIDKALVDHELIKVRFQAMKEEKEAISAEIVRKTGAELVEILGNVAVIYRQSPDPEKRTVKP